MAAKPRKRRQKSETNTEKSASRQHALVRRTSPEIAQPANPFALIRRLGEDMERLVEDFGFGRSLLQPLGGTTFGQATWWPDLELLERDKKLVIRADLPGMTKDDVHVEVNDGQLTISGERRQEKEEKVEGFYRSERAYGSFCRSIPLPEGAKTQSTNASFRDGVLQIELPMTGRAEHRGRSQSRGRPNPDSSLRVPPRRFVAACDAAQTDAAAAVKVEHQVVAAQRAEGFLNARLDPAQGMRATCIDVGAS